jgi:AcrR family transcriptional regulator
MNTRERILDVAEKLFAEHGLALTSLRSITAEAGVNLAAVNYHFQSKEALIKEVLARRIGPVNERRLEMLDADSETLEAILEAFFLPVIELRNSVPNIVPLIGRIYSEPGRMIQNIYRDHMQVIAQRFLAAFHKVAPELSHPELIWKLHFLIGTLAHTMASGDLLKVISNGACDPTDVQGTTSRMIAFCAAGLRAPVPQPEMQDVS